MTRPGVRSYTSFDMRCRLTRPCRWERFAQSMRKIRVVFRTLQIVFQTARRSFLHPNALCGWSCLIAWSLGGIASAQVRDGNINPHNLGRGSWIYILPTAVSGLGGNVPSVNTLSNLMTYLKNQGLQYVIIKAAQADGVFQAGGTTQFTPEVVAAGHAAGLKVFGYLYTTGANVPGEIAMADFIFNQGADGLIYDAESEWETVGGNAAARSALAIQLCGTVRTNWPNKFMGVSTWPYRALHPNLPYKEFAYYCDVIMPQAYWIELGVTPTVCVNRINSEWTSWKNGLSGIWTNAIKPFVMTGQGWSSASGNITAAQISEFENALRNIANPVSPGGFRAVDYWRAELHPAQVWAAIRTNFLAWPYTNAPLVQYPPVATVQTTTATISWPTDQGSDGVVEYGLTPAYGSAKTNSALAWYHTVSLTGLSPNTTYHYRVHSKGTNNLIGYSANDAFTTAAMAVPDIVIDEDNANNTGGHTVAYTGNWSASTAGAAYLGYFRYASPRYVLGSPDRTARFIPNLPVAGNYNIYASWSASAPGGNRAVNAPFRVYNGSDTTLTRVNEEANGNSFQLIASNRFLPAGTVSYIEVGNDVTQSVGGDIVIADAVKLVYLPPPPTPPAIVTPPQSLTVNQGDTIQFTVTANGTGPLAYQWRHAGADLPGATGTSFVKFNAQPADAGTYQVVITNAFGSISSAPVTLTVQTAPVITVPPQNLTVTVGASATFSVTANGSPSPTYQWRFNDMDIPGATGSSYTKAEVQLADAGDYTVVISNIVATILSEAATLTVTPAAPQIDSIVLLPSGQAQLLISGGPGQFVIEQSTFLTNWTPVLTTNLSGPSFQFTDPESNQPMRFYRAVRLVP